MMDDVSLAELFRIEAQSQVAKLSDGLIALEEGVSPAQLEELMRAAHSLKGAARIVGHDTAVRVAHELEECFVAAQSGRLQLTGDRVDVLLRGVDVLAAAAAAEPDSPALAPADVDSAVKALRALVTAPARGLMTPPSPILARQPPPPPLPSARARDATPELPVAVPAAPPPTAVDNTERMLSLAGEALVAARSLLAQVEDDALARRAERAVARALDEARSAVARRPASRRRTCSARRGS